MRLQWLAIMLLASTLCAADSAARKWTDATGKFSVEAELVDFQDGKVRLKKANGNEITVSFDKLCEADQKFLEKSQADAFGEGGGEAAISRDKLTGKPKELANDDGKPAGKKSFPQGHASGFDAPDGEWYLTSVRIHGGRYGYPAPPKEDFHVWLCDKDFKELADFKFPYSRFAKGPSTWVTLKIKPTKVPKHFVIALGFNAEATKGVYISHDAEGTSLVGLAGEQAGTFGGGDWLIRPSLEQLKTAETSATPGAVPTATPEKAKAEKATPGAPSGK
jgi:hypothetical protein